MKKLRQFFFFFFNVYSKHVNLLTLTKKTTIFLCKFSYCLQNLQLLLSKYGGSESAWNYFSNKLLENQCFQGVIDVFWGRSKTTYYYLKYPLRTLMNR